MAVLGIVAIVAGAFGVLGSVGPVRGEPAPDSIEMWPVSVVDAGDAPLAEVNTSPAVSDAAGVIAFVSGTEPRVWIRDRVAGTTTPVADEHSEAPGISGDGCVVSYAVTTETAVALAVIDRCATEADAQAPVILDSAPREPDLAPAPAALSFDGATVAWSTGNEIRRYARTADSPYQATHIFDVENPNAVDTVTGADLDMSSDGATIVYLAGPGESPFLPEPANVMIWNLPDPAAEPTIEIASVTPNGEGGVSDSSSPTISSDGSLVVFASQSVDLAAVDPSTVVAPVMVAFDRVGRSTQVLLENADRPAVSADGNHVVYEREGAIRVLSTGVGVESDIDRTIDALVGVQPGARVSISQFGRWVVFDSASVVTERAEFATGTHVWAADLSSSDESVLDTTTTSTTAPPTTDTSTVPDVTTPASSTTVPVDVAQAPVTPWFSPRRATYPRVALPSAPRRTSYTPNSSSSYPYSSIGDPVGASATSVQFAPTVIDAGRRTEVVTLTNPAGEMVGAVSVEPTGVFSIVDDSCTGSFNAGCTVSVQFAPTEVGAASASIMFDLDDGSVVSAMLEGVGTPAPTMDLVPAVAGRGQTVTVFGTGFPAGSTIEFRREGTARPEQVAVDGDGTFAHVLVVLPNTPTGPMALTVPAQTDTFDDVTVDLLVSTRGAGSGNVALHNTTSSPFGR